MAVSEFKEIMTVVRPTKQPTRGQVGEVEERVGVKRDFRARMPES